MRKSYRAPRCLPCAAFTLPAAVWYVSRNGHLIATRHAPSSSSPPHLYKGRVGRAGRYAATSSPLLPLSPSLLRRAALSAGRSACAFRCRARASSENDDAAGETDEADELRRGPRFRTSASENPRRSFLADAQLRTLQREQAPDEQLTPNERVARQVQRSMAKFNVASRPRRAETADTSTGAPSARAELANVSPLKALSSAAISFALFALLWSITQGVAERMVVMDAAMPASLRDVYVLRRLAAVARTAIVASFALGSGLSLFTGAGLVALSARVTYGRVTGEFRDVGHEAEARHARSAIDRANERLTAYEESERR